MPQIYFPTKPNMEVVESSIRDLSIKTRKEHDAAIEDLKWGRWNAAYSKIESMEESLYHLRVLLNQVAFYYPSSNDEPKRRDENV
jgi:hypothetical protein